MSSSKNSRKLPDHLYIALAIVVVILILCFVSIKLFIQHTSRQQATTEIHSTRIDTGEGSYAIATNIPHQMKFVSPKLGISFLYLSELGVKAPYQVFTVKEVGDKVYLYTPQFGNYTEGKFVQVFQKNSQDDLTTAIQKTILRGHSQTDCFVVADKAAEFHLVGNYPYRSDVTTAAISYPGWNGSDNEPSQAASCPAQYTTSISYFLMDKDHLATFVFFSLGQDNIPAVANTITSWDETLRFLP